MLLIREYNLNYKKKYQNNVISKHAKIKKTKIRKKRKKIK
jgi:hypothetical protein